MAPVSHMDFVGADSIRPNVTEQSRWVNETASNIVPFTAPLSFVGGGRILSAPTVAAAKPPTGRLVVDPYRAHAKNAPSTIGLRA